MEMLSSFGGDKHELCLVFMKLKHVRSCQGSDIQNIQTIFYVNKYY